MGLSTDYYIKNSGSDGAAGTSDGTAWKTICKINDFAEATGFSSGDTINFKCGDTWDNSDGCDEGLGWDGAAIDWTNNGAITGFTVQSYGNCTLGSPGNRPRLDANEITAPVHFGGNSFSNTLTTLVIKDLDLSGMDAQAKTTAYTYVFVEGNETKISGVEVDNVYINCWTGSTDYTSSSPANIGPQWNIYIGDVAGDITVKDSYSAYGRKDTFQHTLDWVGGVDDKNGLSIVWSSEVSNKISGTITVSGNTFDNNYGDGFHTKNIRTTTNVYNNVFSNQGEDCMDHKGSGGSGNWAVYNNICTREDVDDSFVKVDGGRSHFMIIHEVAGNQPADYMNIYDNYIHDMPYGFRLYDGTNNISIHHNFLYAVGSSFYLSNTNNNKIYGNVIQSTTDNYEYPSGVQYCFAEVIDKTTFDDNKIYNNTIFCEDTDQEASLMRFYNTDGQTGNEIRNNVFLTDQARQTYGIWISSGTGAEEPTITHNIVYNLNGAYNTTAHYTHSINYDTPKPYTYNDLTEWIADGHTGGLFSNPDLRSSTDLWPDNSDAAVVGAGYNLGGSYENLIDPDDTDFTASPPTVSLGTQPADWYIGAYELEGEVSNLNGIILTGIKIN